MRKIFTALAVLVLPLGIALAVTAPASAATTNKDRIAIAYECGTTTINWKITVSGPNTAYVQFYGYKGNNPVKLKAYNLKPGSYPHFQTTGYSGLAARYHDLGSGASNLWVHTTAPASRHSCTPPPPLKCTPKTPSGGCYQAGEFCSTAQHGKIGYDAVGDAIKCENTDPGQTWHWVDYNG
jgi:hypothetical protein